MHKPVHTVATKVVRTYQGATKGLQNYAYNMAAKRHRSNEAFKAGLEQGKITNVFSTPLLNPFNPKNYKKK